MIASDATEIFFVLQPGVLLLDFGGPAEAFRIAAKLGAVPLRMHFVGVQRNILTSVGISVADILPLPDVLPKGALVFLVGSVGNNVDPTDDSSKPVISWLRRTFDAKHHRLACVCAGALLAGMAGLLNGRRCTTHHSLTRQLAELEPHAVVEENRIFVIDGPVMTSAGITAGTDLALHIIGEISGDRVAMDVAREMVVYLRRSGDEQQVSPWLSYRNHLHPVIHRIQDMISHEPNRDWPLAHLSDIARVSARHLTRLFRQETGTNIVNYTQSLRVALAKRIMEQGGTVEEAAFEAGFDSARSLRRLWPRFENGTPGQMKTKNARAAICRRATGN